MTSVTAHNVQPQNWEIRLLACMMSKCILLSCITNKNKIFKKLINYVDQMC